jgi:hypothetical protein
MEPSGRNLWQPVANRKPTKTAQRGETVAVGCDPLPRKCHGKEGVSGSSPEEGSAKAPHVGAFSFRRACSSSNVRWVWSPLWSLQLAEGGGN